MSDHSTAATPEQFLEYTVNEIHTARYRIDLSELGHEQASKLRALVGADEEALAAAVLPLCEGSEFVEGSLEYSRVANDSMRDFSLSHGDDQ